MHSNVRILFHSFSVRLNGCYEALEGGNTAEALVDFTGGVSEPLTLDGETLSQHGDQRRALFQMLARAHSCKSLVTCSIRVRKKKKKASVFLKDSAYTSTMIYVGLNTQRTHTNEATI